MAALPMTTTFATFTDWALIKQYDDAAQLTSASSAAAQRRVFADPRQAYTYALGLDDLTLEPQA